MARHALRLQPDRPVIICSGYDVSAVCDELGSVVHCVRKPFELDEMELLVDRLLQDRVGRPA